ncbi:MAG: hypothetical protein AAFN74_12480 [Myxococcota bacterium]
MAGFRSNINLRWIDGNPQGTHRNALVAILDDLGVEIRTERNALDDDDGLVFLDPAVGSSQLEKLTVEFRGSQRPVVTLRPSDRTQPADLLISTFDGLLAQIPEGQKSQQLDRALITLLRRQYLRDPSRYGGWLSRALVNAAIAGLFEGEIAPALEMFVEASDLGAPPHELDKESRMALFDRLEAIQTSDQALRTQLERVQVWLSGVSAALKT